MTGASDIELMIGVAGEYRRVPLVAIAATLHTPPHELRDALSLLFFALRDRSAESPSHVEREPTEGETVTVRYGSVPQGSDPTLQIENGLVSEGRVPTEGEPRNPTRAREAVTPVALTAKHLADRLDDVASLPFYEQLVATVDHTHLQHALDVTLARRGRLHGRPGGYFNAIVRRLTHSSPSYERTSSSSS